MPSHEATQMLLPLWLVLLVIAPFAGSFIGVVVLRNGASESVLYGRSRCDTCHRSLGWRDLIPVVSWVALGRRCRYCRAPLSAYYPLVEIAAAIPVLWAASMMSGLPLAASAVFGWMLLTLALIDGRTQRLPDALTFGLIATGLVAGYFLDRNNMTGHVIGSVLGFAAFALVAYLYRLIRKRNGLGMGDAKLLAGLGAWLSWEALAGIILFAAIAGLVFVLGRALCQREGAIIERVPFGPFLALAGWIIWLYGPLLPA